MYYPIYFNPKNNEILLVKKIDFIQILPKRKEEGGRWRWGKETFLKMKDTEIVIKQTKNGTYNVYTKMRLSNENGLRTLRPKTIWKDPRYDTAKGGDLLTNILHKYLGDFNPKPLEYIKDILKISTSKNSIILDFFAGSGTTGHAVLELNKEDGGNRKFILCTNNEDNNGNGYKIAEDVCYPRIKKVIKGYKNLKGEKVEGLVGNFKYFKTDFVDAGTTDKNKKKLVDKSTEMLCLKEDCFDKVMKGHNFRIFTNGQGNNLGIIYDDDGIKLFKKEVKKLKKKFVVYVFSLDNSAREEEFEDIAGLVELKPIPAIILNIYRRIFR